MRSEIKFPVQQLINIRKTTDGWSRDEWEVKGEVTIPPEAEWKFKDKAWFFHAEEHIVDPDCRICQTDVVCVQEVTAYPERGTVIVVHEPMLGEDYDPSKAN